MNLSSFLAIAAGLLDGFIALERWKDPAATDAQIAADVVGDLKHQIRVKLGPQGFFVDLLWGLLEPHINTLVTDRLKVEAVSGAAQDTTTFADAPHGAAGGTV